MSLDLYKDEIAEDLMVRGSTDQVEPGVFHNFAKGTAKATMQGFARAGSALHLLGSVSPILMDKVLGTGTRLQDQWFRRHEQTYQSAVDYWEPKPDEVGEAGRVAGSLLSVLPQIFAAPGLALATTQVGTAEDLVRKGTDPLRAQAAGAVNALGLGIGFYVPMAMGTNLTQRLLIGGAGFNIFQGVATRAATQAVLERDDPNRAAFAPFDPTAVTTDILLGLAFGGWAHLSKAQRAEGAQFWNQVKGWAQNATAGEKAALATIRLNRHLTNETMPGAPKTPADQNAHVQRMRAALDQIIRGEKVDVEGIKKPPPRAPEPNQQTGRVYGKTDAYGRQYRVVEDGHVVEAGEVIDPTHPNRYYPPGTDLTPQKAEDATDPVVARQAAEGEAAPPAPEKPFDLDTVEDALTVEHRAMIDAGQRPGEMTPEQRALDHAVVTSVVDATNPETVQHVNAAIAAGRMDIARVIVARAVRAANTMNTTPGVARDNPKFGAIEKDLKFRADNAKIEAARLAHTLEAAEAKAEPLPAERAAGTPPEGVGDGQRQGQKAAEVLTNPTEVRPDSVGTEPAFDLPPDAQAAREAIGRELLDAADAVALEHNATDATGRLLGLPDDLPTMEPLVQAKAIGRAITGRLAQNGMPAEQAVANGMVWEQALKAMHKTHGVDPAQILKDYGVDIAHVKDPSEIDNLLDQQAYRDTAVDEDIDIEGLSFEQAAKLRAEQTSTPEFKRWFGDSTVVDDQGKPLVMYRGSVNDDAGTYSGAGPVFVTAHPEFASLYARGGAVYPVYVKAENVFDASRGEGLSLWKQFIKDTDAPSWASGGTERGALPIWQQEPQLRKWLADKGIEPDAIWFAESNGKASLAVADRKQIKSAIGNSGAFDPTNPNILMQAAKDARIEHKGQTFEERFEARKEELQALRKFDDDTLWRQPEKWEAMEREELLQLVHEMHREATTARVSYLKNRLAWEITPKFKHIAAIDADGLGWVNDNVGHEAGNRLLAIIGQSFHESGVDVYHISGDEFMAHHDDPVVLRQALENARAALEETVIHAGDYSMKGLSFSFGIARAEKAADEVMYVEKRVRTERGARAVKGQVPPGARRRGEPGWIDPGRTAGDGEGSAGVVPRGPERRGAEPGRLARLKEKIREKFHVKRGRRLWQDQPAAGPRGVGSTALRAVMTYTANAHRSLRGGEWDPFARMRHTAEELAGHPAAQLHGYDFELVDVPIDQVRVEPDVLESHARAGREVARIQRWATHGPPEQAVQIANGPEDFLPMVVADDMTPVEGAVMYVAAKLNGDKTMTVLRAVPAMHGDGGRVININQVEDLARAGWPKNEPDTDAGEKTWYYREMDRQISRAKLGRAPAGQWKSWLNANRGKLGIKADEVEFSGIMEWLDTRKRAVTKDEILGFLQEGGVKLEEIIYPKERGGINRGSETDRINALTSEYAEWTAEQGFPGAGSADEFLAANRATLTRYQQNWLENFSTRWEEAGEDYFTNFENQVDGEAPGAGGRTQIFEQYVEPGPRSDYKVFLLKLPVVTADTMAAKALAKAGLKLREDGANREAVDEDGTLVYPKGVDEYFTKEAEKNGRAWRYATDEEAAAIDAARMAEAPPGLPPEKSHWTRPGEENVVAHIRTTGRVDADGKKVLFVEEVQSDWAQKGRDEGFAEDAPKPPPIPELEAKYKARIAEAPKVLSLFQLRDKDNALLPITKKVFDSEREAREAYSHYVGDTIENTGGRLISYKEAASAPTMIIWKDGSRTYYDTRADAEQALRYEWTKDQTTPSRIPKAPFVTDTKAWTGLALKRMIAYAAENGYDRVAWTTGEQQAKRYNLAQHVSVLTYTNGRLMAYSKNSTLLLNEKVSEAKIKDYIGQDLAQKLLDQQESVRFGQRGRHIEPEDMEIGGEGMKGFYDEIVPQVTRKLLRDFGGKEIIEVKLQGSDDRPVDPVFSPWTMDTAEMFQGAEDFRYGDSPVEGESRVRLSNGDEPIATVILDREATAFFVTDADGTVLEYRIPHDTVITNPEIRAEIGDTAEMAKSWIGIQWRNKDSAFWKEAQRQGITYPKGSGQMKQMGFDITPELRQKATQGLPLFQKPKADPDAPRGGISLQPGRTIIALFENYDASTFPHESAHLFLEIHRDLSLKTQNPQARQDWETTKQWLGLQDDGQIPREAHEKWARGFEKYLAEGQAPNEGLRRVFQQFREWLIGVYENLGSLRVNLTDEMRGVYARLLDSQAKDPVQPIDAPPAAMSREASPPPPLEGGPRVEASTQPPEPWVPKDVTDPEVRDMLTMMAEQEAGWDTIGGRMMGTETGKPNFSPWVPRAEWWMDRPGPARLNEKKIRIAVKKAIAGEKLNTGEARTIEYMLDVANKRLESLRDIPVEEQIARADDLVAAGIEPTTENMLDVDLWGKAYEVDPDATMRAAEQYQDNESAFMAEVRRIVDEADAEANRAADAGSRQADREPAASPERQEPEGRARPADDAGARASDDGEPAGDGRPRDDDTAVDIPEAAARRFAEEYPDMKIRVGTDDQGDPIYKSPNELLEDARLEAEQAREDARLFEVAAECILGIE